MDISDLKKEFDEMEKNRGFFPKFINKVCNEDIFGYRSSYILLRPHIIIREALREIKFAWQRVFRGWDDRVTWSVDYWLDEIMPDIITKLKNDKIGVPAKYLPNLENVSKEELETAREKFYADLDIIINGFLAAKKISDFDYKDKEYNSLVETFESGMKMFTELYFNLWD